MESERIGKRIATMAAELADLLAEPFDALNTAERCALTAQWETLTRSQAVVGHRLVAGLADAPARRAGRNERGHGVEHLVADLNARSAPAHPRRGGPGAPTRADRRSGGAAAGAHGSSPSPRADRR